MSVGNVSATLSGFPVFNGTNFKTWKNKVTLVLGCMDLDHPLREPRPAPLIDQSSLEERRVFEMRERSNCTGLMIINNTIVEAFLDTMSKANDVRHFLDTLKECFVRSDKAEMSAILRKLVTMWYKGDGNIRKYVLDMFYLAGILKGLKIELPKDVLVHLI
ncbi:TROVE domain-like protein [Dioscorea alata]|uniref:TROVE domain-like protein n=1 Tax=Dioscorea alata TaxID=55571 RepID=A0ACB7V6F8_DIOAL|nr:TROVE domain-like protein [Dioscorea alata]